MICRLLRNATESSLLMMDRSSEENVWDFFNNPSCEIVLNLIQYMHGMSKKGLDSLCEKNLHLDNSI